VLAPLMKEDDESIWDHYAQGRSAGQIGRDLELNYRTVQRRLGKHGGIRPAKPCRAKNQLRFDEREDI
jgi:hypothetical protein